MDPAIIHSIPDHEISVCCVVLCRVRVHSHSSEECVKTDAYEDRVMLGGGCPAAAVEAASGGCPCQLLHWADVMLRLAIVGAIQIS